MQSVLEANLFDMRMCIDKKEEYLYIEKKSLIKH